MSLGILEKFKRDIDFYFSEVFNFPFAKPYWFYLSLSHKCTYRCKMCEVVKILNNFELTTIEAKRIIDEIAALEKDSTLVITGGEALIRHDIFDIIDYAVNKGVKTELVSNGCLINADTAKKIISSGLRNIAISLDGAREETHDSIREKGAFNKAVNALMMLTEEKRKNKTGPQVSVWTTIMRENVRELSDVIPLVSRIGVECLVYHPVIVAQDDMQNTYQNAPFWLKGEDLEILEEQISRINEYREKNGLIALLHDPYLWLDYFKGSLSKKQWKCNPFVFINIGPDGFVRSCGPAFGNIKELSLEEILNTNEACSARKNMQLCNKPCLQTCWANSDSDSLLNIVKLFIQRVNQSGDKGSFLKEALTILQQYEDKVRKLK